MKKFKFLTALIILLIFTSCSSDSADDDDDNMGPPVDPVTYSGTVKAIIDGNCLGCHTNPPVNSAPMPLTTYDNVKDAVSNRGLIGRVESGTMPPVGDDLTSAQIKSIKDWQTGGFKE
jgi:mono/diheme cytochrome c family protein